MALLSAFNTPAGIERIARELLKYGVGSLIGVGLVVFLAQVVYAQQGRTLDAIAAHAQHNHDALERQLQLLRIICLNLADTGAERALCDQVSR